MPRVELDQDICDYLAAREKLSGESANTFIRKLLRKTTADSVPIRKEVRQGTDLDKFLSILSQVAARYPSSFSQIAQVQGSSRVYFAKSPEEIRRAGSSTSLYRSHQPNGG